MFTISVDISRDSDIQLEYAIAQQNADSGARKYGIGQFRYIPGIKPVASNAAKIGIVKRIKQPKIQRPRTGQRTRKLPSIGDLSRFSFTSTSNT